MLEKYAPTQEAAEYSDFYKAKIDGNGGLLAIYKGEASPEAKAKHYEAGKALWARLRKFIVEELPPALPEAGFIGGDKPGEADYHVGGWLARIVSTVNGKDVDALSGENALDEPVPPKVAKYYAAWSARDSWKSVYAEGLH